MASCLMPIECVSKSHLTNVTQPWPGTIGADAFTSAGAMASAPSSGQRLVDSATTRRSVEVATTSAAASGGSSDAGGSSSESY